MSEPSNRIDNDESSWRSGFSEATAASIRGSSSATSSSSSSPPSSNSNNNHSDLLRFWQEGVNMSPSSFSEESDVDFSIHQSRSAKTPSASANNENSSVVVPADQERQILLLMLLAQVCALTDPTPRTFTVHVLELFERGILDRESIVFLFDLGLVPSSSKSSSGVPRLLPPPSARENSSTVQDSTSLTATNNVQVPLRVLEASAIRNILEQQELDQQQTTPGHNNNTNSTSTNRTTSPTSRLSSSSWSAEHYPLHLSRFQREFTQVGLIASGGFGHVHRCIHNMDGKVYAVKCVKFNAQGFDNQQVQQVVHEIVCLAHCHSKHVVRYYTSWLEPSWMTGASSSPHEEDDDDLDERSHRHSNSFGQRQSLKLLTDVHRVVNRESPSEILKHHWDDDDCDDYLSRRPGERKHSRRSSFDPSESFFEFNNSRDSDDDDSLFDRSCQSNRDDLYVGTKWESSSKPNNVDTSTKTRNPKQRRASYRYQICLYIQMELCHRNTLADWIREANRSPNGEERRTQAVQIFGQICRGLAHVHSKSVVHRDMKPANIFRDVDDPDAYKIGDFGLSKRLETLRSTSSSPKSTNGFQFTARRPLMLKEAPENNWNEGEESSSWQDPLTAGVGTASYAAPEQVASTSYGKKADIFSLGLILLEMLCPIGTEHERIQTFRDLRSQRALPAVVLEHSDLADVILKCTDPDPSRRPGADELCNMGSLWTQPLATGESAPEISLVDRISQLEERVRRQEQELTECRDLMKQKDSRIQVLEEELVEIRKRQASSPKIEIPARFLAQPAVADSASLSSKTSTSSSEDGM